MSPVSQHPALLEIRQGPPDKSVTEKKTEKRRRRRRRWKGKKGQRETEGSTGTVEMKKKEKKKRNALAETEWIRVGGRSSGLIYTLL